MLISASSQWGHTCVCFFLRPQTNADGAASASFLSVAKRVCLRECSQKSENATFWRAHGEETKLKCVSHLSRRLTIYWQRRYDSFCASHTHAHAQQRLIHKRPNANDNPFVSVFSTRFYPEIPVALVCSIPLFNPVRLFPLDRLPCLLCLYFNFSAVLPCRCRATVVLSCCLSSVHSRRGPLSSHHPAVYKVQDKLFQLHQW